MTNLAARLCGEAQGGQILVTSRVVAAAEELIQAEEVGALSLRGLSRPVPTFNVVGLKPPRLTGGASRAGGTSERPRARQNFLCGRHLAEAGEAFPSALHVGVTDDAVAVDEKLSRQLGLVTLELGLVAGSHLVTVELSEGLERIGRNLSVQPTQISRRRRVGGGRPLRA